MLAPVQHGRPAPALLPTPARICGAQASRGRVHVRRPGAHAVLNFEYSCPRVRGHPRSAARAIEDPTRHPGPARPRSGPPAAPARDRPAGRHECRDRGPGTRAARGDRPRRARAGRRPVEFRASRLSPLAGPVAELVRRTMGARAVLRDALADLPGSSRPGSTARTRPGVPVRDPMSTCSSSGSRTAICSPNGWRRLAGGSVGRSTRSSSHPPSWRSDAGGETASSDPSMMGP